MDALGRGKEGKVSASKRIKNAFGYSAHSNYLLIKGSQDKERIIRKGSLLISISVLMKENGLQSTGG